MFQPDILWTEETSASISDHKHLPLNLEHWATAHNGVKCHTRVFEVGSAEGSKKVKAILTDLESDVAINGKADGYKKNQHSISSTFFSVFSGRASCIKP